MTAQRTSARTPYEFHKKSIFWPWKNNFFLLLPKVEFRSRVGGGTTNFLHSQHPQSGKKFFLVPTCFRDFRAKSWLSQHILQCPFFWGENIFGPPTYFWKFWAKCWLKPTFSTFFPGRNLAKSWSFPPPPVNNGAAGVSDSLGPSDHRDGRWGHGAKITAKMVERY